MILRTTIGLAVMAVWVMVGIGLTSIWEWAVPVLIVGAAFVIAVSCVAYIIGDYIVTKIADAYRWKGYKRWP